MEFIKAFLGLMLVIITMAVVIPVTAEILPTMINDMGAAVGVLISAAILVIIVAAIFVFMQESVSGGNHADLQGI